METVTTKSANTGANAGLGADTGAGPNVGPGLTAAGFRSHVRADHHTDAGSHAAADPSSAGPHEGTTPEAGQGAEASHHVAVLVGRMRARLSEEWPQVLWSMSDDEVTGLLVELQRLVAQVDAGLLATIREIDRRDLGRTAGAANTSTWVSGLLKIRPAQANRRVKLARDLDTSLVMTPTALNAGEINLEQADVIAQTLRDLPSEASPELRIEVEQAMLDEARVFHPQELTKIGQSIVHVLDPDLADLMLAKKMAAEDARFARERQLSISDDPYGTGSFLRGKLDAETAEMLRTAVEPLAKPRPTDANTPDTRSPSQRLGDGLHELLRRYLDSGKSPTHAGEKPHVVVTVSYEDMVSGTGAGRFLHTGSAVPMSLVRRYACDCALSFHVTGGTPSCAHTATFLMGNVRLFTGKTRRLLDLRDRGCAFPGCDRPPAWCEGHHVVSWLDGGPTTVANGTLLCRYHHRLIHQGGWQVQLAHDGYPEFIPPNWIDPHRKPQRNNRLRM